MVTSNFCTECGAHLEAGARFCTKCGAKAQAAGAKSPKSAKVALVLCLFLGMLGIHRFYVGKIGTGILMLLTGGGFGLWVLVDLIFIVNNKFEDKQGNLLELTRNPSPLKKAMLVIGVLLAGFILYVATLFTIVMFATSGIVGTVKLQLDALRSGDIEKAYSYTSKDFQKATPYSVFKSFVDKYPSLKNNESSFFNEREIKNNIGTVKGTLTAKDGAKTPIEYQLIKEDGTWKILGMNLLPTGASTEVNNAPSQTSSDSSNNSLTQLYENQNSKYSIKYPANWEYEQPSKGTVIFSGKKGTPAYFYTVSIQTVLAKKTGGSFATVKEFTDDLKKQIVEQGTDGKILDQGEAELPQNTKLHGEYFICTYKMKGHPIKQMQFVIFRDDEQAFYAWAYTAPESQYNLGLSVAKSMYESWVIN